VVSGGAGFETTIETTEGSVLLEGGRIGAEGRLPKPKVAGSRTPRPLRKAPTGLHGSGLTGISLSGEPGRAATRCEPVQAGRDTSVSTVSHRACVAGGWPPIPPRERSTHSSIFAANAYTRGRGSSTARSAAGSAVAHGSGSRSRAPSFAHADVQQNVGYAVYLHAGAACRGADALTAVARRPPTRCAPTRRRF